MGFKNRAEAGQRLADHLIRYRDNGDALVLALPRGGVPVGYEVARRLRLALDVFLVRKLGVPGEEELALGALASGGIRVFNEDVLQPLGLSPAAIESIVRKEQGELDRREKAYRGAQPAPVVQGRTIFLIDDGLATGATMRAAARALRLQHPARLIVGVPVADEETCRQLRAEVDEVVCVLTPSPLYDVGRWYDDFPQTTDEEVQELLTQAAGRTVP